MDVSFTGIDKIKTRTYKITRKMHDREAWEAVNKFSFVVNNEGKNDLEELEKIDFFKSFPSENGENSITLKNQTEHSLILGDSLYVNNRSFNNKSEHQIEKLFELLKNYSSNKKIGSLIELMSKTFEDKKLTNHFLSIEIPRGVKVNSFHFNNIIRTFHS